MKKNHTFFVELLAAAGILLLAIAVLWILFPSLKTEIGAAWVQAVGSVIAIGAAVLIARGQEYFRRDEQMEIAKVAGATMLFRLALISKDLNKVGKLLGQVPVEGECYLDFSDCLKILKSHPTWTPEQLALLAPLPNRCAYEVATGSDRLHAATALLTDFIENLPQGKSRKRKADILVKILRDAETSIDAAVKQIEAVNAKVIAPGT